MGTSPHDLAAPRAAALAADNTPHHAATLRHSADATRADADAAAAAVSASQVAATANAASRPSPEFWARFLQSADAQRAMPFEDFMRLALYDPQVGYYTRARRRIGRGARGGRDGREGHSDFFTATTVGEARGTTAGANLFGELVVQSCLALAGEAFCAKATFVEIGAEPEPPSATESATGNGDSANRRATSCGVLRGLGGLSTLPFAAVKTISVGEDLARLAPPAARANASDTEARAHPALLPSPTPPSEPPPLIVFSNELFDAQPCRRFVRREQAWREIWVHGTDDGALVKVEHTLESPPDFLPKTAPQGYRIDAPLAARQLLDQIVGADWRGLFLTFDYGKSWRELCEATPQGTARAYTQHRQSSALLDQPGEQDLTCHICWDWLQDALAQGGFRQTALESQEGFFVKHAGHFIGRAIAADARQLSPRKQALMQLLHPANMGQKFQALSALRGISPAGSKTLLFGRSAVDAARER